MVTGAASGSARPPPSGWPPRGRSSPPSTSPRASTTSSTCATKPRSAPRSPTWWPSHGRLDSVVHAAGVAGGGPVHLLEADEWDRVIDVNLKGTFLVDKYSSMHMLAQGSGSIVNIASIEGIEGTEGGSAYNASKGGVVMLTKSMAIDYGRRGIRVNCICPGGIDTPLLRSITDAGRPRALPRAAPGRPPARPVRPARGDRRGRRLPRLRGRLLRDRTRPRGRRRVHRRAAGRACSSRSA